MQWEEKNYNDNMNLRKEKMELEIQTSRRPKNFR